MPYKRGFLTTEFWITVLVILGQAIAALSSNLTPKWAAIGASIAGGLYALARGLSKQPVVSVVPAQTAATVPPTVAPPSA